MTSIQTVRNKIDGQARTVRELLDKAKYSIDFYQREYNWEERQVREMLDDLTSKFLEFFCPTHSRRDVEGYGHYFLGSIVISHKKGQRFVVDGQQRLTTLTLLLIHLHHIQDGREERVEVQNLIYSEKYGHKSFNLDIPDRKNIMRKLMDGDPIDLNNQGDSDNRSESVRNIANRYSNIADFFPEEEIGDAALPFFIDWLLENVHLVEIEAYSDEDAYTIFETMNDRGLSLSLPEMLKGYLLANIHDENEQKGVDDIWKENIQKLKELGSDEDADFFKNWFRAKYAETIRQSGRGTKNRDFERIGAEFHRWIRENHEKVIGSDGFEKFVMRDMRFYADWWVQIGKATRVLTDGWESIRYNEDRGFTLQTQVLLAPLTPEDSSGEARRKIALVADYLDIWLARRVWNLRTIRYSSVKNRLFTLTKELRGFDTIGLSEYLCKLLKDQSDGFNCEPHEPLFSLRGQNHRQVRHILARLTHWLDTRCGLPSNFEDLVSRGQARPFEIEHIWADHYDRFKEHFSDSSEFERARNHLGGLLLLQRGLNQSLRDKPYEEKRDAYYGHSENLLARSLHPHAYKNLPSFKSLREKTDLPFRPCDSFGPKEQRERQELYTLIAERIWDPSRVNLEGESSE